MPDYIDEETSRQIPVRRNYTNPQPIQKKSFIEKYWAYILIIIVIIALLWMLNSCNSLNPLDTTHTTTPTTAPACLIDPPIATLLIIIPLAIALISIYKTMKTIDLLKKMQPTKIRNVDIFEESFFLRNKMLEEKGYDGAVTAVIPEPEYGDDFPHKYHYLYQKTPLSINTEEDNSNYYSVMQSTALAGDAKTRGIIGFDCNTNPIKTKTHSKSGAVKTRHEPRSIIEPTVVRVEVPSAKKEEENILSGFGIEEESEKQ